jgi:hypothetical protein
LEDETQGIDEQQCGWGGEITDEDEEIKPAEANMDADLATALGLDRIEPSGAFPPQGSTEVLESEECPDTVRSLQFDTAGCFLFAFPAHVLIVLVAYSLRASGFSCDSIP